MDKIRDNSLNPYASTYSPDSPDGKPIEVSCMEFDGMINEDDYASLMPSGFASLLFSSTMIFVVFPLLCVMGIGPVVLVFSAPASVMRGQSSELIFASLVLVMLGVGAFLVGRYFNPSQRVRRNLERYPDLLGPMRGKISASGLRIEHQGKEHWFDASYVVASHWSEAGIRFPLSADLYRYVALTRRQFLNFDARAFANIAQQAGMLRLTQPDFRSNNMDAPSDLFFEQPDDAIPFAGEVSFEIPTRTKQQLKIALVRTALLIASVVIMPILLSQNLPVAILLTLYIGVSLGKHVYQLWRLYFLGKYTQKWKQSGWLNSEYLVVAQQDSATRILLSKLQLIERTGERLMLLPFDSSHSFCILASNFKSTNDWQRINQILDNELLSRTRSY